VKDLNPGLSYSGFALVLTSVHYHIPVPEQPTGRLRCLTTSRADLNPVTIARTNSRLLLEASYGAAITRIINMERGRLCALLASKEVPRSLDLLM
jgi:hypothetical protein